MIKLGSLVDLPGIGKFQHGEVISNPFARAFAPIKEEEVTLETHNINEAAEIKFEELTPTHQKQVKAFEKVFGGKHTVIFEGIHGIIVDIKISNPLGVYRFEADDLKKLLALKIRWVEGDKNTITIGF